MHLIRPSYTSEHGETIYDVILMKKGLEFVRVQSGFKLLYPKDSV
jgi:hypothetical protein